MKRGKANIWDIPPFRGEIPVGFPASGLIKDAVRP